MSGFENDIVFAKNADFSQADNQLVSESNGLITNGQLWIGRTAVNAGGTHIDVGTLTAGSGVTITNGPGTITISLNGGVVGETITGNSGGALSPTAGNWNILGSGALSFAGSGSTLTGSIVSGGINWTVITVDQTAVINNGYICNKASALLLTLPATASVGSIIKVTGINTNLGWKIVQSANQQIFFGTSSTTLGATGFIQSSAIRDSIEIVCVVAGASTVYNVLSSVGNLTVN